MYLINETHYNTQVVFPDGIYILTRAMSRFWNLYELCAQPYDVPTLHWQRFGFGFVYVKE